MAGAKILFERLKYRVHLHFYLDNGRSLKTDGKVQAYIQGADDCLEYLRDKAWNVITEDQDSYPPVSEYVLVKDEQGDLNVAYCDADYDWFISNGENSLILLGNVVKWIPLG